MDTDFQVLVVQTGGTIDKDYPRATGQYAFEIGESAALKILNQSFAPVTFRVTSLSVCRKDSQDITISDRRQIADALALARADHIVVTHGTDTLIETATFVESDARLQGKKIVFVGSFKPECFKGSDAAFNVGVAIGGLQYCPPGVYVAMNGRVRPCTHVQRNPETGVFIGKKGVRRKEHSHPHAHGHADSTTGRSLSARHEHQPHEVHHQRHHERHATPQQDTRRPAAPASAHRHPAPDEEDVQPADEDELYQIFIDFSRFGKGQTTTEEMDGKRWVKFCKENSFFEIDPKHFSATSADLVFSKISGRGRKTISFETFCDKGLPDVAKRLKMDIHDLLRNVRGPKTSRTTRSEFTKFHDDKSSWTGVATNGGPSTVDIRTRPTLASQANRDNKADVRGVVKGDYRY
eukprot:INCI17933.1.p1 GENE.INCI17933.1~~INCI17933.1.p1  ORF type:complete len:407 (+),score=56.86 INCI17933.1:449-1669(+)